jgi:hypothetical protein
MGINDTLLLVMAGAVVVSALALVIMVILLGAMAKAVTSIKKSLDNLAPKAESVLENAQKTLVESKKQISDITTRTGEVLEMTRDQLKKTDEFLTATTSRARIQLDRVELVVEDTLSRLHGAIVVLNKGVVRPLREINGVASGVRAAVQHMIRGGRPSVAQATTDEEMFI